MLLIRSLLFHISFYCTTFFLLLVCLFVLPFHRRYIIAVANLWARVLIWLFNVIVGCTFEVRNRESLPQGEALILASKHMSVYETFALLAIVKDPLFILKRELMWIPLFGWAVAGGEMIPIDRGARSKVLKSMMQRTKERMKDRRQLIIFPEGTRRPTDADPAYKYGISYIYRELNVPCYPVALNTGLFWPRQSVLLYPGKIIVEILPPIEPGLKQGVFFEQISTSIEENSNRLIAEARAAGGGKPAEKGTG
ncbi:1-acyl-sn-glycerol-3-phosphate acyltransferase [Cohaesibacter sp. ES.047]|uniref:lysophospholipid acyltransferase family protein n=1 Tax=Cohaesibacter sp. ES.047 TaxID=1798205 RepID=UPI000BB958E8|nr:lysophospholipid acyltransferase family protein [Cohaesibacter sp. ES.047]SNY90803.1 1-acyl-sn-glycerol-3-phosphate acyltransferase [Cohaesibacter sp. ES.047]